MGETKLGTAPENRRLGWLFFRWVGGSKGGAGAYEISKSSRQANSGGVRDALGAVHGD